MDKKAKRFIQRFVIDGILSLFKKNCMENLKYLVPIGQFLRSVVL
jgi:hypothetical protein